MISELKDIKKIRKQLSITQQERARLSGVSQSLITKIEAGKIDPSYSGAVRILNALAEAGKEISVSVKEIMQKKVLSITPMDKIAKAITIMKKHGISQLPVMEHKNIVGLVSENILLEALLNRKGEFVKDIMQDAPPIVSLDATIKVVSHLLKHYPIVIVSDKGNIRGLVTKADLLSVI